MKILSILLLAFCLQGCAGYQLKNIAKFDIDFVADEFISTTRATVAELVVKLYKRNPAQLRKVPGMTIEARLAQLRDNRYQLDFVELDGNQGIAAMNLAFDPGFHGDRVFALAVGLGGMLREAYNYKPEVFMPDRLDAEVLMASARNVEVLVWKLKHARRPDGQHYLITHEYQGVVDNLSFERMFGELIVLQEMMARIVDDSPHRTVTSAVHAMSTVFIPLPM